MMVERRSHLRFLDCEPVFIHWTEDAQNVEQLGDVDDVSLSGVRVRVDDSIPVGTAVKIFYESLFNSVLTGVVRYRLERPEGIFLGIEFIGQNTESMLLLYPELFSAVA